MKTLKTLLVLVLLFSATHSFGQTVCNSSETCQFTLQLKIKNIASPCTLAAGVMNVGVGADGCLDYSIPPGFEVIQVTLLNGSMVPLAEIQPAGISCDYGLPTSIGYGDMCGAGTIAAAGLDISIS